MQGIANYPATEVPSQYYLRINKNYFMLKTRFHTIHGRTVCDSMWQMIQVKLSSYQSWRSNKSALWLVADAICHCAMYLTFTLALSFDVFIFCTVDDVGYISSCLFLVIEPKANLCSLNIMCSNCSLFKVIRESSCRTGTSERGHLCSQGSALQAKTFLYFRQTAFVK